MSTYLYYRQMQLLHVQILFIGTFIILDIGNAYWHNKIDQNVDNSAIFIKNNSQKIFLVELTNFVIVFSTYL